MGEDRMLCEICGQDPYRLGKTAYPLSYHTDAGHFILVCLSCAQRHAWDLHRYSKSLKPVPMALIEEWRAGEGEQRKGGVG